MGFSNSIKNKLFFLLCIMGAIPFIIIIIVSATNMINEWEKSVEKNGTLRNSIVSEYITNLFQRNFYVLHAAALNPLIIDYVQNPAPEKRRQVKNLLHDTNAILRDKNAMALTGANAQQLLRTDTSRLVNIGNRQHFHEAMSGKDFVSDVLVSMSNGKLIVVLTCPVRDRLNRVVGVIQRNFNLSVFQDFVESWDDEEISVIILNRDGKIIANSKRRNELARKFLTDDTYRQISEHLSRDSETIHTTINGEDSLVSYSRNDMTDWIVITVQPYRYILKQVYYEIMKNTIIGVLMLVIVSMVAYFAAAKATRPIIEISTAADKIISGKDSTENLNVDSQDEIGQMAAAFNKMRSDRDAYQLEAKRDNLTDLYNKIAFETLCTLKLQELKEHPAKKYMAMYIIDLDHFKEVNDTKGHQYGDKVLIEFASRLKKCFRASDYMGRFGGDEFMVLIDDLPHLDVVIHKAKRINLLARTIKIDDEKVDVSASIGISIIPMQGLTYEEVFKAADKALYFVKNNGRDNYHCAYLEK